MFRVAMLISCVTLMIATRFVGSGAASTAAAPGAEMALATTDNAPERRATMPKSVQVGPYRLVAAKDQTYFVGGPYPHSLGAASAREARDTAFDLAPADGQVTDR